MQMEKVDLKTNIIPGVFNQIASIIIFSYSYLYVFPEIEYMGLVLIIVFFLWPLLLLMLISGIMTYRNAKSAPVFQFFVSLLLFFFLYAVLTGGWMGDARSSANFGHWHQLIFLYSLILLWAVEMFFSISWISKNG
jgi:hypothetical protein